MSLFNFSLILVSVSLSVVAQILLKDGMSNSHVQNALQSGAISAITAVFSNLSVIGGLATYVSSAGVWLLVLSKIEVSKAYPFVGLGFIGTMFFAYWFLNEPLTLSKMFGTLLVIIGILLISLS
ncbi:EamA family transporter [Aliikangiella coralliicola]|uniref:EamA family transporter n=1 Tax=Aliikangiella coralliicola TaxID=2592383 RepID=A0A545UHE6_9GAMM|nr:EamA family transporter [Aliikangiella coralliicola]TQV88896.1 EamA family transporter [Aliikangiella coralliicola]